MTYPSLCDLAAACRWRARTAPDRRGAIRAALDSAIEGSADVRALRVARAHARSAKPVMTVRPKTDAEVVLGIDVRGRHPGAAALRLAHEVLSEYSLPPFRLSFDGVRRTAGAGGFDTTEGFVMIGVHFTPPNDVREHVTLPFAVKEGRLLSPGVLMYHGQVRVLSAPTFEDILKRGELYQRVPDRSTVFGMPLPGRRVLPQVPVQRAGLFGRQIVRR